MPLRATLALAVVALLAAAAGARAFGPVGSDFRVSEMGSDGDAARYAAEPAIAHAGDADGFLVAWDGTNLPTADKAEIWANRVTATGGAQPAANFRVSNTGLDTDATRDVFSAAVAYNPTAHEYMVVFEAEALTNPDEREIYGQRLTSTGAAVGGDFRISTTGADGDATRNAADAAIAYDPAANQYLVVWNADGLATDEKLAVFGQRLSATGAELGGDFPIASAGDIGNAARDTERPAVAYDAATNEYLVAWSADALAVDDDSEVFAQRIGAGGAPVGTVLRVSTTGVDGEAQRQTSDVALAYDAASGGYLAVWDSDALADGEYEVFGQRISGAGARTGPAVRISSAGADGDAARDADNPAVAYDSIAHEFLVVWEADGLATDDELEIFGQRLSATGAELGSDFRISTTGVDGDPSRSAGFAAVAFDPGHRQYLVGWQGEGMPISGEFEIFARRIDATTPSTPPPGGGGGPPADTFVTLTVTAQRRQHALKRRRLVARAGCGAEACALAAATRVRVPRAGGGARIYRPARVRATAAAGARARIVVRLSRKVRRAVRRALRQQRRVTARIAVTAGDAAGNSATQTVRVRLRR